MELTEDEAAVNNLQAGDVFQRRDGESTQVAVLLRRISSTHWHAAMVRSAHGGSVSQESFSVAQEGWVRLTDRPEPTS